METLRECNCLGRPETDLARKDRKSTRLNSSHLVISYAVFCLKKKKNQYTRYYYINFSFPDHLVYDISTPLITLSFYQYTTHQSDSLLDSSFIVATVCHTHLTT